MALEHFTHLSIYACSTYINFSVSEYAYSNSQWNVNYTSMDCKHNHKKHVENSTNLIAFFFFFSNPFFWLLTHTRHLHGPGSCRCLISEDSGRD